MHFLHLCTRGSSKTKNPVMPHKVKVTEEYRSLNVSVYRVNTYRKGEFLLLYYGDPFSSSPDIEVYWSTRTEPVSPGSSEYTSAKNHVAEFLNKHR
jgi:hypothetical protein